MTDNENETERNAKRYTNSLALSKAIEIVTICPQLIKPEIGLKGFANELLDTAKLLIENDYISHKNT